MAAFNAEVPPLLLRTTGPFPSSKLGSNAERSDAEKRVPQAIIVGKGFSDEEVQQMQSIEGISGLVPWLLPHTSMFTWTMMAKTVATGGIALPAVVAERAAKCLRDNGLVPGRSSTGGKSGDEAQIWFF